MSVTEYSTSLKIIWDELDSLNVFPAVAVTPDVTKLLETISSQREEARLFRFLNGSSDQYNIQRSRMLMQIPLRTVEIACAAFQ